MTDDIIRKRSKSVTVAEIITAATLVAGLIFNYATTTAAVDETRRSMKLILDDTKALSKEVSGNARSIEANSVRIQSQEKMKDELNKKIDSLKNDMTREIDRANKRLERVLNILITDRRKKK